MEEMMMAMALTCQIYGMTKMKNRHRNNNNQQQQQHRHHPKALLQKRGKIFNNLSIEWLHYLEMRLEI